jgi:coronin-1B/1C/6
LKSVIKNDSFSRFYRLNNNGFCQVIPFVVPRKSELFQEDLYPDTVSDVPAITAEEWWEGTNKDPILVPMSEVGTQTKKVIQVSLVIRGKYLL